MRTLGRLGPSTVALSLALASGAAIGLPKGSKDPLADLAAAGPADPAPAPNAPLVAPPKSPFEVEIALKQYDEEDRRIAAEIAAIDEELAVVDERVVFRGKAYFKQVRAGLLPAGGGFDELVDHAARVERTRLALTRDLEAQKSLRKRQAALTERQTRLRAERAPLDMQREAIAQAKGLMRQAEDRRRAFDRAFESSTAPPDYVAIYGADRGPSDAGAEPFSALYGRLPLPVAGRAEVRKLEASGNEGPALEIRAPAGASARVVAAGRVVFADLYQDALHVIVDHGERHFTVYGNLVRAEVKVGESVAQNAPLGTIAARGAEGSILYFEIRKNGQAVPPGPWFGL